MACVCLSVCLSESSGNPANKQICFKLHSVSVLATEDTPWPVGIASVGQFMPPTDQSRHTTCPISDFAYALSIPCNYGHINMALCINVN